MILLILYLIGVIGWLILISTYEGKIDNPSLICAALSWAGVAIFILGMTAETLKNNRRLDI